MAEEVELPEKALLLIMIVVSTIFLIESRGLTTESAMVPRIFAIVCITIALLLLLRKHLPEPIASTIMKSGLDRSGIITSEDGKDNN